MNFFKLFNTEYDSALEQALKGVPFSGDLHFSYDKGLPPHQDINKTPVYLLPFTSERIIKDLKDDKVPTIISGFVTIDGKPSEAPLGFVRKQNFIYRDYFLVGLDGDLGQGVGLPHVLYLPLILTNVSLQIGSIKDGGFVPAPGSPFFVYGIRGAHGVHPLIYLAETSEGIHCRGIYHNKNGDVFHYKHNPYRPSDDVLRDFLRSITFGPTVAPQKPKELQATATVKKEEDKPLVEIVGDTFNWHEPKSIVAYLDESVVSQHDSKRVIAVAVSNYMTRITSKNDDLSKENILLIGPSGVGKTLMIELLAKKAGIPFVQTKLTGKSSTGYKNENLSTVFDQVREKTEGEAPTAIVFFDELDKIARDEWGSSSGFGPRLQDELIGWLEGAPIKGEDSKKPTLNTRNILFVAAGAFHGDTGTSLVDIIAQRVGYGKKQLGFIAEKSTPETDKQLLLRKTRPEDLIAYGLKPELVGRMPAIGILDPLSPKDLLTILNETKRSPLKNYQQLLHLKGYALVLDPEVPHVIVSHCPPETGARALRAVCNDLFTEILFEPEKFADDKKIIRVTPELAQQLINIYG